MDEDLGWRLEAALGELLQRRTRMGLYAALVAGIGHGLDISSYPVLSGVARTGPITAARLGVEIGLDRSGVSRHATRLVEGGLLLRRPDPDDARGTLLALTPVGEQVVAELRRRLAAEFDLRLAAWPPAQARAFVSGLERFIQENRRYSGAGVGDQVEPSPEQSHERPAGGLAGRLAGRSAEETAPGGAPRAVWS